tara:strand:+ start:116829 stop:116948 length:120 start_codon:yes stop_codon:yes gene_type:complete
VKELKEMVLKGKFGVNEKVLSKISKRLVLRIKILNSSDM